MKPGENHKLGRNDPCTCGSGKKYKACCARTEAKFSQGLKPEREVWRQQARRAVAGGDFSEAEHWFRRLHSAKPNDPQVLAGLGQSLCWQGRRREGIGYLLKSAKILERQVSKSGDPRLILELSGQMMHWGEPLPAERLARLAVRLAPRSPAALNNLALCLSRIHREDEALPVSRQACELLPDDPGCNILLATLEARLGRRDTCLARLQHVIALDHDPDQTARAWLETGVVLDQMGRYGEAFAAFSRSAEARRHSAKLAALDRELLFDSIRQSHEAIDPLLGRWPVDGVVNDGLPVPAFLMGFLRSGTTLTEQVLGAHPDVLVTDESGIVHELTLELGRISGVTGNQAQAVRTLEVEPLRQLRQFFWRRMREEYGDDALCKQLVDKNALNTLQLGLISVVFPEAKILFALRDPRDVCLSCFGQAFAPAPATVNLLSWQGIARQYAAVMGYWLAIRETMPPSSWLELRYEDTVGDFETAYRGVFAFLGLEWRPEVGRFHERAKGRFISTPSYAAVAQPLYSGAIARWKHYENQLGEITPLLEPFIAAFGYSG
jgi:Flp pilus assembly protein TadD